MNTARMNELFGGRERFEVLRALFLNPNRQFTNQALATSAKASPGNVHRLLLRWADLGLVRRHEDGRNILYQASDDPLLRGLQDLFLRNDALIEDIKAALPKAAEVALIHGSVARGEEKATSDIDVLILGDGLSSIKVNAALKPVGRKHDRAINASVHGRGEFARMAKSKDAFALSVLSNPTIMLKGELHAAA